MLRKFKYQDITWIDLEAPTKEEIEVLAKDFNLHALVAGELRSPSARSKVDVYQDYFYLILHFPLCQICRVPGVADQQDYGTQEVDFVIGHNFLITTHYEAIDPLHELSKIFELEATWERSKNGKIHPGIIFFKILKELYRSLETGLDYINDRLKKAEGRIFSGEEKPMVKVLSEINRDLLDCRWALKSHREVLGSLELSGEEFFGEKFRYYLRSILGQYEKIWQMIESNRETFQDLRETNESLLSIKTNETMKTLTVVAFIFFPLTLIGQIFGMNTHLPFVGGPYDFYIVVVIMIAVLAVMWQIAKNKRWL
ncbi:MAG: magnesium transporter CorA family protein [Patescibacteria group bacterium]